MTPNRISSGRILFKVGASRCDLRVGDRVTPETTVGEDFETGETVKAGSHGRVESISFSADDHALIVLIKAEAPITEDRPSSDPILFKIDASRCDLRVGDRVTPETTVGEDFETGEIVKAGRHGQVEAISFSGDDHALIVVISPAGHH
jgi:hypothetical protein